MITVAIINKSTALQDSNVQAAVPALQIQVSDHFAPIWGVDAQLVFIGKNQQPPPDAWQLIVLDNSDQAGALGYHETKSGDPIGYVFAKDDLNAGLSWTVTASHELLELLADPYVFSTVFVPGQGFRHPPLLLALEVADACESDQFGYDIQVPASGNQAAYNVKVSDFVTPAWFGAQPDASGKYSFKGYCTAPYQILSGGYIGAMPLRGAGNWTQVTGQAAPEEHKWTCHQRQKDGTFKEIEAPKGSRRERRHRHHQDVVAPMFGRGSVGNLGWVNALDARAQELHTALFGPVRNDMDNLIGEAAGSLHKFDNVAGWLVNMLSNFATSKNKLRIALDKPLRADSEIPSLSIWLEPKS